MSSTASLLTIIASNTGEAVPERHLWLLDGEATASMILDLAVALVIPIAVACKRVRESALCKMREFG